jgi:hypothetical protein
MLFSSAHRQRKRHPLSPTPFTVSNSVFLPPFGMHISLLSNPPTYSSCRHEMVQRSKRTLYERLQPRLTGNHPIISYHILSHHALPCSIQPHHALHSPFIHPSFAPHHVTSLSLHTSYLFLNYITPHSTTPITDAPTGPRHDAHTKDAHHP